MITSILALLGCLAITASGCALSFFGALGNDVMVYIIGIIVGVTGVAATVHQIFGWFV